MAVILLFAASVISCTYRIQYQCELAGRQTSWRLVFGCIYGTDDGPAQLNQGQPYAVGWRNDEPDWSFERTERAGEWWYRVGLRLPSWRLSSNVTCGHIAFPLWIPILPLLALATWLWRREGPNSSGICANCRYDLTGNTSGVCPECGERVEVAAAADHGEGDQSCNA